VSSQGSKSVSSQGSNNVSFQGSKNVSSQGSKILEFSAVLSSTGRQIVKNGLLSLGCTDWGSKTNNIHGRQDLQPTKNFITVIASTLFLLSPTVCKLRNCKALA
jgi:hypothetical protein